MRKVCIEKNGDYLHFISIDGLVMCPMVSNDRPCMVRCAWFHETEQTISYTGNPAVEIHYIYMCGDKIIGECGEEGEDK